jgi:hypothetical protein
MAKVFLPGMADGRLFLQLKPDEIMERIPKLPPMIGWMVLFGMFLELAGMALWTYRIRQRGPGLLLASACPATSGQPHARWKRPVD